MIDGGFGFDGSRGFAQNVWNMLNDGGIWGIPRCGIVLQKDATAKTMTVITRMPWFEGLSCTPEELFEAQEDDVQGCTDMFAGIGVTVIPLEI